MTRTRWIIFAAIVLVTLGGLVALQRKDSVDVSNVDVNAITTEGDTADHVYGKADSKVVVIEYADYQCPGCGGAYPQINAIKEQYKDKVAFVFRNFPLTTIHPNALAAAAAAEAASLQGKFWEMHDLLFESQSSWENLSTSQRATAFEGYASQLGLNIDQFKTDIGGDKVSAKIAYDRALGGKAGVNSTPTIILNGKEVSADIVTDVIQQNGDLLKKELDAALKAAGETPPTTTN